MTYYRYQLEDWIGEERIYTKQTGYSEWSTFVGNKHGARQAVVWESEEKARAGHGDFVASHREFKDVKQEISDTAPVLLDGAL